MGWTNRNRRGPLTRHLGAGSTRRSLVRRATENSPRGNQALDQLCRAYYGMIYTMLLARCRDEDLAQDLTQDFLAKKIMTRGLLKSVDASRQKFRAVLGKAARRLHIDFLRSRQGRARGRETRFSSDGGPPFEGAARRDIADSRLNPEEHLQQSLILDLLDRVYARMRQKYAARGREALFDALEAHLPGRHPARTCEELAELAGIPPATVRQHKHRLWKAYWIELQSEGKRAGIGLDELAEQLLGSSLAP